MRYYIDPTINYLPLTVLVSFDLLLRGVKMGRISKLIMLSSPGSRVCHFGRHGVQCGRGGTHRKASENSADNHVWHFRVA
jgi:hypothetical protein